MMEQQRLSIKHIVGKYHYSRGILQHLFNPLHILALLIARDNYLLKGESLHLADAPNDDEHCLSDGQARDRVGLVRIEAEHEVDWHLAEGN